MTRVALEVTLTIPDNEARTALATLRRLGCDVGRLRRADVYVFEVDDPSVDMLEAARASETIFNASKHALRVCNPEPGPGEAWIDEDRVTEACDGVLRIAGRPLPGVRRMLRYVAWSLADDAGTPEAPPVLDAALDTLLCNPAFQKAIR